MSEQQQSEWLHGQLNHKPIWIFYSSVNFLGALLCAILCRVIWRSKRMSAIDVFVIGLLSGCFFMSIPCATQCMLNRIGGTQEFQYGWPACVIEAYAHVSAIEVQFFSIALIAWCSFMQVVKLRPVSPQRAWQMLWAMWIVNEGVTAGMTAVSRIELPPGGTYCFHAFNSPTIVYWFVPVMLFALASTIYFYWRIFDITVATTRATRTMRRQADEEAVQRRRGIQIRLVHHLPPGAVRQLVLDYDAGSVIDQDRLMPQRVARRTIWFVLAYFAGWFPAVVACIYAEMYGDITEELELTVGIFGSLHSVAVPFVYGFHNRKLHRWLARYSCFRRCFPQFVVRIKNQRGDKTMVTNNNNNNIDEVPALFPTPSRTDRSKQPSDQQQPYESPPGTPLAPVKVAWPTSRPAPAAAAATDSRSPTSPDRSRLN